MESLPPEIVCEIIRRVDESALWPCSMVSKLFYKLSMQQITPITNEDEFRSKCFKGDVLSILHNELAPEWIPTGLFQAGKGNHSKLIRILATSSVHRTHALWGACDGGHHDLVQELIQNNILSEHSRTLYYACKGGNMLIVQMIVSQSNYINWKQALKGACAGGHIEIVNWILCYGKISNCDEALAAAAAKGYIEIMQTLPKVNIFDFELAIERACYKGQIEAVEFLLLQYEDYHIYWNETFLFSCMSGSLDMVKFIVKESLETLDYNEGLKIATEQNNIPIAEFMIQKGAQR